MLGYDFKTRAKVQKKEFIRQLPAFQCKKNAVFYYFCLSFAFLAYKNAGFVSEF